MLDSAILNQLRDAFALLESPIQLVLTNSSHPKSSELRAMADALATTSSLIEVRLSEDESVAPHLEVHRNQEPTGISFTGVPGGHEFTSLVLGILHCDHKGKLPDRTFIDRIRRLEGHAEIKTVVSLSCQNCPEVVQALNLVAAFNGGVSNEMVDGDVDPDRVEAWKIKSVPAVVIGDEVVHTGRSDLGALLEKLETHIGTNNEEPIEERDIGERDVVVVGAGPAGVAAAIYCARKGLKTTMVADRMGGQLRDTKGIENFISMPYVEGNDLSGNLREHLQGYDIELLEHRRVDRVEPADERDDGFAGLWMNSGEHVRATSLVVATGAKWKELGVQGEREYLGRGVAFCPHCDGPFYKDKPIAVIGGGNSGVEAAIDLAGIVERVTLVEWLPELGADEVLVRKLKSLPNIEIVLNSETKEVLGDGDKVTGLRLRDRSSDEETVLSLDGVFVQIGLKPNSQCVEALVDTNPYGEIVVDAHGRTSRSGIYAAGDVTTVPFKQIVVAMGDGAKAGLAAFEHQVLRP